MSWDIVQFHNHVANHDIVDYCKMFADQFKLKLIANQIHKN